MSSSIIVSSSQAPTIIPTQRLFDHIQQREWDAARQRLLECPSDAYYQPPIGQQNQATMLRWSCVHRAPMDVIGLLIDANPNALVTQDSMGFTPLHFAIIQGCSEELVVLLIRRGEIMGSSLQSPRLGSPLSVACRHGSSVRILRELMQANPAMATVGNEYGLKPSQLLWHNFERHHGYLVRMLDDNKDGDAMGLQTNSRKRAREEVTSNPATIELMQKLSVLVEGIQMQQRDQTVVLPSPLPLIRDMVESQPSLGNMSKFLQIVVLQRPEELLVRDARNGNFILHLAAAIPVMPAFPTARSILHPLRSGQHIKDTIDILAMEYPWAARVRNDQGHFPLHLALCEGRRTWKTGVAALTRASFEPLQCRERRTGLYPFQLAAMSAAHPCGQSAEEALETIYQLLLACPHVLSCESVPTAPQQ